MATDEYLVFVHLIEARGLHSLYVLPHILAAALSPLNPLAGGMCDGTFSTRNYILT